MLAPRTSLYFIFSILIYLSRSVGSEVEGNDDSTPYISAIMCGRNDFRRGDFVSRLQNSLDFLSFQSKTSGLSMEVIVVEWNPFLDSPSLATLVRAPPESRMTVRIITVDPSFHSAQEQSTGQNFF
eukprot:342683-Hanusia_phi.AAC.1